jgi:hypothetical protein
VSPSSGSRARRTQRRDEAINAMWSFCWGCRKMWRERRFSQPFAPGQATIKGTRTVSQRRDPGAEQLGPGELFMDVLVEGRVPRSARRGFPPALQDCPAALAPHLQSPCWPRKGGPSRGPRRTSPNTIHRAGQHVMKPRPESTSAAADAPLRPAPERCQAHWGGVTPACARLWRPLPARLNVRHLFQTTTP